MCKELIIDNYSITASLYDILQDVQSQLFNGKLRDIKEKGGDEIAITCPFHKDGKEDRPSCYVYCGDPKHNIDYGVFHCFTCGEKGPFWKLIAACFDKSENWAKQYLIKNYGKPRQDSISIDLEPIQLPNQRNFLVKTSLLNIRHINNYLQKTIDTYQSWHPYMAKRHLSRQVCENFQIKYDPVQKCIVFPVWDDQDNLVMMTKRSIISKKFYIDADKQKPVYLLNYIKKNNIKTVYVCESQINCLYMWSLGYPAIALFGTGSQYQYQLLNRSDIEHYYLCFDGDEAGDNGIQRFMNHIKQSVFIDIVEVPRGKDMNDLTKEEITKLRILDKNDYINLLTHKKN